jgi:hypothetical protein
MGAAHFFDGEPKGELMKYGRNPTPGWWKKLSFPQSERGILEHNFHGLDQSIVKRIKKWMTERQPWAC